MTRVTRLHSKAFFLILFSSSTGLMYDYSNSIADPNANVLPMTGVAGAAPVAPAHILELCTPHEKVFFTLHMLARIFFILARAYFTLYMLAGTALTPAHMCLCVCVRVCVCTPHEKV